jgi:2-alkenal reductase
LPTLAPQGGERTLSPADWSLAPLYAQVNPGVVNIQVIVERNGQTGQGAGSGFVISPDGYIVTNNHVVDGATTVTVSFYSGLQASAKVIGVDPDSDLAVIQVDKLPEGVHALSLGDSDAVEPGQWVVAIGNPFGLGSSMSLGIVSAVGRTIPSGATPFDIPQAIQTDAAINPGNSGGPLMNLSGEVIGVNAQIATGGVAANAGVGFAIPSNVVARVAPVLISDGSYTWPWIGVTGGSVNLAIMQANKLPNQQGAYLDTIVENGPAAAAGLQGSSGTTPINGLDAPVGGDVIVAVDGRAIVDFTDLLVQVTLHRPGDRLNLTVLRDGRESSMTIELAARPQQ